MTSCKIDLTHRLFIHRVTFAQELGTKVPREMGTWTTWNLNQLLGKYSNQVAWRMGLFFGQLGWASKSHFSNDNLIEKVAQGLCTTRNLIHFTLCLQLWVQLVSKQLILQL
jgi:hypothetical protein